MTVRAVAVWWLLLLLAVLNGGVRDTWLSPRLGDPIGRAISTLVLCGLIFLATWVTIGWIRPTSTGAALRVGALWVVLTLAFEFGVGSLRIREAVAGAARRLRPEPRANLDRGSGRHPVGTVVDRTASRPSGGRVGWRTVTPGGPLDLGKMTATRSSSTDRAGGPEARDG
jgi:hypothetical protein